MTAAEHLHTWPALGVANSRKFCAVLLNCSFQASETIAHSPRLSLLSKQNFWTSKQTSPPACQQNEQHRTGQEPRYCSFAFSLVRGQRPHASGSPFLQVKISAAGFWGKQSAEQVLCCCCLSTASWHMALLVLSRIYAAFKSELCICGSAWSGCWALTMAWLCTWATYS